MMVIRRRIEWEREERIVEIEDLWCIIRTLRCALARVEGSLVFVTEEKERGGTTTVLLSFLTWD